eukprot:3108964-Pyramimonas_sp.AAC.2
MQIERCMLGKEMMVSVYALAKAPNADGSEPSQGNADEALVHLCETPWIRRCVFQPLFGFRV